MAARLDDDATGEKPRRGRPPNTLTDEEFQQALAVMEQAGVLGTSTGKRDLLSRLLNRGVTKDKDLVLRTVNAFRPKEIAGDRTPDTARDTLLINSQYAVEILMGIARSTLVPIGLRKSAAEAVLDVATAVLPKRAETVSTSLNESTVRIQVQELAGALDRVDPLLLAKLVGQSVPGLPGGPMPALPAPQETVPAESAEGFVLPPEGSPEAEEEHDGPVPAPVAAPATTTPRKTPEEKVLGQLRKYGTCKETMLSKIMKPYKQRELPGWKAILDAMVRNGQIERARNGTRGGRFYCLPTGRPLPKSVPKVTGRIRKEFHKRPYSKTSPEKDKSPDAQSPPPGAAPAG